MEFCRIAETRSPTITRLRIIERITLSLGVILLAAYGAVRVHGLVVGQAALASFSGAPAPGPVAAPGEPAKPVDFSEWATGRIQAYKESLGLDLGETLAVLRIPSIDLEVPVLDGTSELVLNVGVGRIIGTSRPGESGNLGIAGHRDGFFRGLEDVSIGDEIELEHRGATLRYLIEDLSIVGPNDVDVLAPTPNRVITLVTCYPFYYVGSAPQRYIVRAELMTAPAKKARVETES